jgi:carbon-monoxide dehydrogenase medium subunit
MSFDYHEPASIREAVELGARFGEESRFLAGWTDLMIQIHRGRCAPRQIVSLHRVPGLDGIDGDGTIAIGALVTHRRLERAPAFQGALRALVESAEAIGGHQIRNVATVGGNVVNASPAADVVPVLLMLEATVTCLGPGGERTMPLHGFASGPGVTARRPDELLTRVAFPPLPEHSATAFLKAGRRRAMEISLVCVAARVTLDPSWNAAKTCASRSAPSRLPRSVRGGGAKPRRPRAHRGDDARGGTDRRQRVPADQRRAPRHDTTRCS